MRTTFIEELIKAAREHENILLIVGDLGYSVVEPFIKEFPKRFINVGVAEQNMAGIAAGMASEGHHVFAYSIANFPTFRCAEQIRNDIDYHNLSVTTVAVGGGLSYGPLGYSHHAVQDYGLMRLMPNMKIAAPGDPNEVRACVRHLIKNPGPSYLRIAKAGEPNINNSIPILNSGEINQIIQKKGSKIAVITTGAILGEVYQWVKSNHQENVDLFSCPLWGMKEKKIITQELSDYKNIITVEDHLMDGGFGSWVMEAMVTEGIYKKIIPLALSEIVIGKVGLQKSLNSIGGLDLDNYNKKISSIAI